MVKKTKVSKALAKTTEQTAGLSPIVRPAVSAAEAIEAWKAYQELKKAVLDRSQDIQVIQGREFLKKSYWRKLATFFNLSVDVVEEKVVETPQKNIIFHFVCKATAPNGRYAIGAGSADKYEKGYPNTLHNTRATAETRAFNRAVSNLVGGGEVSAEEVDKVQLNDEEQSKEPVDKVPASAAQRKKIFALGKKLELSADETKDTVKKRYALGSFTDLSSSQANDAIERLEIALGNEPVDPENKGVPLMSEV